MEFIIDGMKKENWDSVRAIYKEGIDTGNATFEENAPSWEKWDSSHLMKCRLVARAGDAILGWVALSPVSSRCSYQGVAEVSLYVNEKYRGLGVGTALLEAVIRESEKAGIWTLQAGIFPENKASIQLNQRLGFRRIGVRKKLGKMTYGPYSGKWRDVVMMERRSGVVGVE